MSEYAIRTCTRCGKKKPASRIYTKSVWKPSMKGSSRRSINLFTWFGLFFGDKGALRAIKQWLFQSSNRRYKGEITQEINLCSFCYHRVKGKGKGFGCLKILLLPYYLIYKIITSPLFRELFFYIVSWLVWVSRKFLKLLSFLGMKIIDQDRDGKLDQKDLEIAYNKVSSFFEKIKKKLSRRSSTKN